MAKNIVDCPNGRRSWYLNVWLSMMRRCFDPLTSSWYRYGGRGITVCSEWQKFEVFIAWCESQNPPWKWSIERKDVDGNYCPENCCFIPLTQQAWNRRTTYWVEYDGQRYCLQEFVRRFGVVPYATVQQRIGWGWEAVKAAMTPLQGHSTELWSEERKATQAKKTNVETNPHLVWVEHEGQKYMQKDFIEKFAVVDRSRVFERMKQGWSVKDAVLKSDKRFKMILHEGVEYPLEEFIKKFATISKVAVYRRIRQGWDVKQAVLAPPRATCVKGGLKKP